MVMESVWFDELHIRASYQSVQGQTIILDQYKQK